MSRRRGFTMVDLVVLMLVSTMLLGMGMCSTRNARHSSNRVRCASNLRQIGLAMLMYANENRQAFPRTRWEDGAAPTAFTGAAARDPFGEQGPGPNDVSAIAFLLLRTQDLAAEVFICPVDNKSRWQGDPQQASNFADEQNLSYSFHNAYADSSARFGWNNTLGSDIAIAADMNPGVAAVLAVTPNLSFARMREANSRNHYGDGQNVMYGDAHTEWHESPFAGAMRRDGSADHRDNIYKASDAQQNARGGGAIWASPVDAADAVLLPVGNSGPLEPLVSQFWAWIITAVAAAVIVTVFVLLRRLDRVRADKGA